jgi:hypothetical protein
MAKHKYIETPEKMWELFLAYRKEVKENPRKKHVFVGKDGVSDYELLERPLTIEGFSCYLAEKDITTNLHDYLANTNDAYTDYSSICRTIKEQIRRDQIEGGMVGQYNPSITQRLNNLTDKVETTIVEQQLFPDVE